MKKEVLIASMIAFSLLTQAQRKPIENTISANKVIKSQMVVVDMKMIQKFRDHVADSNYICLSDIYKGLCSTDKIEFLKEYSSADLSTNSYLEIKNRVIQNSKIAKLSEEDIEHFCAIKKEINRRLTDETLAKLK